MSTDYADDPQHWRDRAARMRALVLKMAGSQAATPLADTTENESTFFAESLRTMLNGVAMSAVPRFGLSTRTSPEVREGPKTEVRP
jgi:hypothetical protein